MESPHDDQPNDSARFIKDYLSVDSDACESDLNDDRRDLVYENGRRYHSLHPGRYLLPNDAPEQTRLNMAHHLAVLALNGALHVVELPHPFRRVLDIGAGTGAWAIDMAQRHPTATILGIDLSPIQPAFVPANCSFIVDDIETPWHFREPFDFIHSGNMAQGIRDWPKYIARIYENLVPNGVVELMESRPRWKSDDWSIPVGGYIERYNAAFERARRKAGLVDMAAEFVGLLREAGFVDVVVVMKKVPFGTWVRDEAKKELGRWALKTTEYGVKSYGLAAFTRELGMGYQEAVELCEGAYAECRKKGVHTYFEMWFVVARKPGVGETVRT